MAVYFAAYLTLISVFFSSGFCSATFRRRSLAKRMKAFGGRRISRISLRPFADVPEFRGFEALLF
jgi:hypothetical protein